MSSILGVVGGFLKGATSGGLFSIITGIIGYFKDKKQTEKEIAAINAQKELAIAKANGDALLETLKIQGAAIEASYSHDTKVFGKNVGWLDNYRGTLRPNVCYLLLGLSAWITVYSILKVGIDNAILTECAKYGLYTCMDSASFVIGWYFGDRQQEKYRIKRI